MNQGWGANFVGSFISPGSYGAASNVNQPQWVQTTTQIAGYVSATAFSAASLGTYTAALGLAQGAVAFGGVATGGAFLGAGYAADAHQDILGGALNGAALATGLVSPELAGAAAEYIGLSNIPGDVSAGVRAFQGGASAAENAGATFGNAASNNYRGTFFAENPDLEGQVVVHHAVPQRTLTVYPNEVTEAQIHSLENLRGIPNEINSDLHLRQIGNEWRTFYKQNPNATQAQLLQKATEIDAKYGSQFKPPTGGGN